MIRSLAALLVVTALIGLAPAAPVPAHLMPKEPLYYATQKGTRWVYVNQNVESVYEATDVKPTKQGGSIVTIELVHDGKKTPNQKLDVSPRGIFRIEVNGNARGQPMCLLRCPAELDKEWPFHLNNGGVFVHRGTMKVTGTEDVTVPAGKFPAVRVAERMAAYMGEQWIGTEDYTSWYAPDVGLVKQTSPGGFKKELKSFKPGNG
ncbi:hypothetical protein J8F10_13445 [Gemmata sp. G18]|uniref:DUF3108 domain-containing protein n=1 Tax=Gemmata palustris TaxID=2822762 RepID=A0ABS5BRD1_9BACT|nr:hypothetical protein [Gemmata palustris]MBP3956289.1 hypothetical protein [Gemmata palustris]